MSGNRTKIWIGLGAYVLAGATGAAAQDAVPPAGAGPVQDSMVLAQASGHAGHGAAPAVTQVQGGEGGEGGEGGGADAATDATAYLEQLAYIRGHLLVGRDLYAENRREDSMIHFHHPAEEIYEGLEPALAARKAPPFKASLDSLVGKAEAGAPSAEVDAAVNKVLADLDRAGAAVPAAERTGLKARLALAIAVLGTAADEYAVAMENGQVVNVAEYQDSLGFMRVAKALIDDSAAELKAASAQAHKSITESMETLRGAWPGVIPPKAAPQDPGSVRAAISRIELAASNL